MVRRNAIGCAESFDRPSASAYLAFTSRPITGTMSIPRTSETVLNCSHLRHNHAGQSLRRGRGMVKQMHLPRWHKLSPGVPFRSVDCGMKLTSERNRLNALAFLYDHLVDFPAWIRALTRGQLESIARIMVAWPAAPDGSAEIVPMAEIERREVIRAVTLCGGDVIKAAAALGMGRTTVYRKLNRWGYSVENCLLVHQASALANAPQTNAPQTGRTFSAHQNS
jgi:Bacterial regulatory protein, Fis family